MQKYDQVPVPITDSAPERLRVFGSAMVLVPVLNDWEQFFEVADWAASFACEDGKEFRDRLWDGFVGSACTAGAR